MRVLSSLRGRIFAATAAVALLSLAFALLAVTRRAEHQAEADVQRDLDRAAQLVSEQHAARLAALGVRARLVADLPTLKAAVATGDPPTVEPLARDLKARADADLLVVSDAHGQTLALAGDAQEGPRRVLERVTVPIEVGPAPVEHLGTLTLGTALDDALARQLRAVTGAEVAFSVDGTVRASSLAPDTDAALAPLLASAGPRAVRIGDEDYLGVRRGLDGGSRPAAAIILRSRAERLALLRQFRGALAGAGLLALAIAVALSWAVARTVTRPLAELTGVMREMAKTGDLARRIDLKAGWSDEDAALVARSFNGLTEAIARFQREAARRDRLAALGRLSAVIAHEVRNPLMVIKSSLASLARAGASPEDVREAVADIDHEVARLDRLVGGVLDYARAPRLQYAPADMAALCEDAARAALSPEPGVRWTMEGTADPLDTDAEQLRAVLVNVLANAREAVLQRRAEGGTPAGPEVVVHLEQADGRVSVAVRDQGAGIGAADLARVFEPYFTTRRAGTGLGLAISRNVVEALGGAIAIDSRVGEGTTVRVDLPRRTP